MNAHDGLGLAYTGHDIRLHKLERRWLRGHTVAVACLLCKAMSVQYSAAFALSSWEAGKRLPGSLWVEYETKSEGCAVCGGCESCRACVRVRTVGALRVFCRFQAFV